MKITTAHCSKGKTELENEPRPAFDELLYLIHRIENNALRDQFIRWISINIGIETAHRRFHRTELARLTLADRDKAISKAIRHMAAEIGSQIARSGQIEIIQKANEPWFNITAEFRYLKKAAQE